MKFLQSILQTIKDIFKPTKVEKPAEVILNPEPIDVPSKPEPQPIGKNVMTREFFVKAYQDIFNAKYNGIRERGKNRHPVIDAIIKAQGGKLGDPYCQFGQQQMIDDLCVFFGIDRKKLKYPEGGGTQRVAAAVDKKYIVSSPLVGCLQTVEYNASGKGHIEFICAVKSPKETLNAAFNSNVDGSGNIRDGEGIGYVSRPIFKEMKVGKNIVRHKAYVDLYAIFVDAIK